MRPTDVQEQLLRRLMSEAQRADKLDRPVAGRFLSGEERSLANRAAKEARVNISFSGGYNEAERVQPCFYPNGLETEYSAQWVEVRWNTRFSDVSHRDLFGSLMGLGMDRSYFGDLIVMADHALLRVMPEIAVRLPSEWTQAGNAPIQVALCEDEPEIILPEGEMQRDTVASLRLDSVLSSGLRTSRAKAAEFIRQGNVQVNHLPEERIDHLLEVGDLLSVRGFGRIRLKEVGSATRKDRLPILLEIFNSKR